MPIYDLLIQHETFISDVTSHFTEIIESLLIGYTDDSEDGAAPSVYLTATKFGDPGRLMYGEGPLSFEDVLRSSLAENKALMAQLFKDLGPGLNAVGCADVSWTFSAVAFPVREGLLCDFASPQINTVAIVPSRLDAKFCDFFSGAAHGSRPISAAATYQLMHIEKLDDSDDLISPALDHLLSLVRTWPDIVRYRDELKKLFITTSHDMNLEH